MNTIRRYAAAGVILLVLASLGAFAQAPSEDALLKEIKLLVFDEKWPEAQARCEAFMAAYPKSASYGQAVFYRSKALEERGGREAEALASYKDYLKLKDRNRNLAEDAEVSIVDLAIRLYESGDRSYLADVADGLASPNKVVRYYAAIQLSGVKDRRTAEKTVPVLKEIVTGEASADLRDRARIALMRVAPEALADLEERPAESKVKILHIEILDLSSKKSSLTINIPWALADMALAAIPDEERQAMRAKGYDIHRIVKELESSGGEILTITGENATIRIWLK